MTPVPHVTSVSGLRKFQADGFLFDRVYIHTWQVYVQTSVIFKHLTQVIVVTLRSDLERKREGKKRYRKGWGGEGKTEVHKFSAILGVTLKF